MSVKRSRVNPKCLEPDFSGTKVGGELLFPPYRFCTDFQVVKEKNKNVEVEEEDRVVLAFLITPASRSTSVVRCTGITGHFL